MMITPARWTIALAAATILAMPMSAVAQTAPPSQPPAAAQPTTPSEQQPPAPQSSPGAEVAKTHLTAARNTLSQITQLPAAAQLQGEARMQVSQLINNFNELITTQADWKAAFAKVETNLNTLLAPQTPDPARPAGTPGAVATTGTIEIDPAIRAKLVEFRAHLNKFEEVASGAAQRAAAEPSPAPAAPTSPMNQPPAAQAPPTGQTPPATPPTSQAPPPAQAPPAQTPPPSTPPDPRPDPEPAAAPDPQEILSHVEAIEVILNANASAQAAAQAAAGGAVGTTGTASGSTRTTVTPSSVTLTQAQIQELRTHLAELRRLLDKK